jgi:hypothetical protein
MKQQYAHLKVTPKIVCMRQMLKKPKNYLNSDTVHVMFHTYHV